MDEKKSITFLKQTFQLQGGLEKYTLLLTEEFVQSGFDVTLLTLSPIQTTKLSYLNWIQLSSKRVVFSFIRMVYFDWMVRFFLRNRKTVLFGLDRHFLTLDFYRAGNGCHKAFLFRRWKEASFLKKISFFFNPLHLLTLLSEKKTFESPKTKIICNSNLVRSEIIECYPKVDREKIHVIHNGVDWHALEAPFQIALSEKKRLREEAQIPFHAIHLVLIGNEWHRKGVDIFLQALSLIKAELSSLSFFVTIAGKERNPKKYLQMARELGIEKKIVFCPYTIKTEKLFQVADICMIPSRYDPFANITVEALAMGLWVCSTRENGGSEVVEEGINGSIAREYTAKALAESILFSLSFFKEERVSKEDIRRRSEKLDIKKSLNKYISLIKK